MIADRFWSMSTAANAVARRPLVSDERTQATPLLVTPALVGFYFCFRTAITLIAVRLLVLESQTGAVAGLVLDFGLLLVVAFQAIGRSERSLRWMLKSSSFRWVLAYLAFALCSLAWSGTVSLPTSFFYWCGIAADVAIVVLMLRTAPVDGVVHSLMKGYIWSACLLALVAWIMPVEADLRLGDMDYFNTNQIGNLCAFGILLAQYLMSRKDGKWGAEITFLAITLVRSLSKSTLAAFVLSEGVLLFRDKTVSRRVKLLIATAALIVGASFWSLYENYYDVYTNAGNQAETLTGRTAIWAFALDAALTKPWFGNGFDALWKVMPPFGSDQFEARHAENEVLQQFFAYGVVGIALLVGVYGSFYKRIKRLPDQPMKLILTTLFLFIVIRGLTEAEPFDLLLPLWAITLIGASVETRIRGGQEGATNSVSLSAQLSGFSGTARSSIQ